MRAGGHPPTIDRGRCSRRGDHGRLFGDDRSNWNQAILRGPTLGGDPFELDDLRPEQSPYRRGRVRQLLLSGQAGLAPPVLDGHLYGQSLVNAGWVFPANGERFRCMSWLATAARLLWAGHLATPVKASTFRAVTSPPPSESPRRRSSTRPARRSSWWPTRRRGSPRIASHHLIGLDLYTGNSCSMRSSTRRGASPPPSSNGPRWPSTAAT